MSLQVWLPLMEDLHNQGLANVTVTGFNTPTFIAGKLGKCCHLSQSSSQYLEIVGDILNTILVGGSQPFSVCFWIKNEETLNTTNRAIICGDYSSSGWNIEIRNTANGRIRFYWSAEKVSDSDTYSYSVLQDEWMHITVIYTGSQIVIYKNGMNPKVTTTTLAERTKTNSKIRIGRDYRSSPGQTYFTGCLNDFRIYDHALSAKEVEEISKGLVLHYKLDDAYNDSSTYNYITLNSKWVNTTVPVIQSSTSGTAKWIYFTGSTKGTGIPLGGNGIYYLSAYIINNSNTKLNLVVEATTASGTYTSGGNRYSSNVIQAGTKGWAEVKIDWSNTSKTDGLEARGFFGSLDVARNAIQGNIYIQYFQLEKHGFRTPYTIGGTTRTASTIVYDSSGYQNNGTIAGSLTCNTDSPRYSLTTNFSAYANYITTPSLALTECSYSLWVKPSAGTDARIIFSDYKSGICFGRSTSYTYCNNTTLDNNNRYARYTIANDNSWQHFVIIRSGEKTITLYKNGELVNPITTSATWSHNNVDYLMIGRRKYSTDSSYAYSIKGDIVDFREYATVLTESQIQELYNTSALIDKNGNIYPRELVEG